MLEHGGRLRAAAARYGIPLAEWLDLSTGISPWVHPVPPLPAEAWQRLPEDGDGLEDAARAYYGATSLLALPGSQAAIMALPRLRAPGSVAVLTPGYGEYAPAWRAAGHAVRGFAAGELDAAAANADVVMLGNPNNPDAARCARAQLLDAARRLATRGGWLVVDEAFADADSDADANAALAPLAGSAGLENLIVLRSLGKFFGLAGARVGFACAEPGLLAQLGELLGPWAVAHPARWAARHALADASWQAAQRARLTEASARLAALLDGAGVGASTGTALFRTLRTPRAAALHAALARQGVLVRLFAEPAALRFGLPGDDDGWQRLAAAWRTALAQTAAEAETAASAQA